MESILNYRTQGDRAETFRGLTLPCYLVSLGYHRSAAVADCLGLEPCQASKAS